MLASILTFLVNFKNYFLHKYKHSTWRIKTLNKKSNSKSNALGKANRITNVPHFIVFKKFISRVISLFLFLLY